MEVFIEPKAGSMKIIYKKPPVYMTWAVLSVNNKWNTSLLAYFQDECTRL